MYKLLLFFVVVGLATGDLVVNVRNQGGEVYKESIESDDETIDLFFEAPGEGTQTRILVDFRNELTVTERVVLSSDSPTSIRYCFVTKLDKSDWIPPDAMAKLRQKNPWSIRLPERTDVVNHTQVLDVILDTSSTDWLSPYLKTVCSSQQGIELGSMTYASKSDLIGYLDNNSEDYLRAVRTVVSAEVSCDLALPGVPCQCAHRFCIGWYPCALKYCRSKENNSAVATGGGLKTYRCGIHTCRSCKSFTFTVSHRALCL